MLSPHDPTPRLKTLHWTTVIKDAPRCTRGKACLTSRREDRTHLHNAEMNYKRDLQANKRLDVSIASGGKYPYPQSITCPRENRCASMDRGLSTKTIFCVCEQLPYLLFICRFQPPRPTASRRVCCSGPSTFARPYKILLCKQHIWLK